MAQNDPENAAERSRTSAEKVGAEKKTDGDATNAAGPSELAHLAGAPASTDAAEGRASDYGEEAPAEAEGNRPAEDFPKGLEAPEPSGAAPPPTRRKSGLTLGRILLALFVLGSVAVGAAFALRDQDERLAAFAEAVENAARDPIAAVQDGVAALFGGKKAPTPSVAVKEAAPVAEAPTEAPPSETAPAATDETSGGPPEAAQTEAAKPAETPPEKVAEAPPPPSPSAALTEESVTPARESAAPARESAAPKEESAAPAPSFPSEEREALVKRMDQLEQVAQSALKTAEEARTAAAEKSAEKPASDGASLSEREYLAALEGRIDELANEIKAIREKLAAPKSELRAPLESAEAKTPPSQKGGAAELAVVAHSLRQEIEKGKPYAVEFAALSSLGANPELLAALEPGAEKGVLTPEQLLRDFGPVAKRLEAIEAPKSAGSYVEHLVRGAGRLVRVRPANEPPSATVSDQVETIRSALKHDDIAAAAAAFDQLPDAAKTGESAFGDLLRQRRDAERASAEILSGAIAALGRNKS
jgi:hypothetical protein